MVIWVLYVIEQDRARTKVAKYCKQAGLYRVQYSCFLGRVTANDKDTLEIKITAEINLERDKVYIFPMSKNELRDTVLLGQAFDKRLVNDEVKALFF